MPQALACPESFSATSYQQFKSYCKNPDLRNIPTSLINKYVRVPTTRKKIFFAFSFFTKKQNDEGDGNGGVGVVCGGVCEME